MCVLQKKLKFCIYLVFFRHLSVGNYLANQQQVRVMGNTFAQEKSSIHPNTGKTNI